MFSEHRKRTDQQKINCPLEFDSTINPGTKIRCGKTIRIVDDLADLRHHYEHLGSGHGGPAVGETGDAFLDLNSKLNKYVKRLKDYVGNNERMLREVEKRGIRPGKTSVAAHPGPGDPDDDDSSDDSDNHDSPPRDNRNRHSSPSTASSSSEDDRGDDANREPADPSNSQPNQPGTPTEDEEATTNTGFANPPVFFEVDPYRPQKTRGRKRTAPNLPRRSSMTMRVEPISRGESGSMGTRRNRLKRGRAEDDQLGVKRGGKRGRGR